MGCQSLAKSQNSKMPSLGKKEKKKIIDGGGAHYLLTGVQ